MAKRSILVVEDEELLQEVIKSKLERDGFLVAGARGVEQGLDFLQNIEKLDAIWLDHFMPEKTGLDFMEAVRKNSAWDNIPIYLVTNTVSPDIINKYLKFGVRQYYVKMLTKLETIITRIELDLQQNT